MSDEILMGVARKWHIKPVRAVDRQLPDGEGRADWGVQYEL